MEEIA
jgi:hypothetical protein